MHREEKHTIIKGSAEMFGSTVISSIFSFLRTIVIARILGPSTYGIWTILMVIFGYGTHSHIGLTDGMNKEMPYLRGKGDFKRAEKVKDATFWTVGALTASICILLIISSFIFRRLLPDGLAGGILILAVIILLFQFYVILTSLLRTDKKFGLLALVNVLLPSSSLLLILLFFKYYQNKLYGALIGLLLGYLGGILFILWKTKYRFKPAIDPLIIRKVFSIGLPLIIIQIVYSVFINIDRWMIAGLIDQTNLGYYGLGITMSNFLFGAFSTVAFTAYPAMLEKFGKTNDPKSSEQLIHLSTTVLSYLLAIICPLASLVIPLFIFYALPAYVPSISPALILVMSVYFISIMTISSNFLISINKQNIILKIQALAILLCIILDYWFIKAGWGIKGVAMATGISYFFYGTSIILLSFRCFTDTLAKLLLRIGKIYSPFFVSLLLLLILIFSFENKYINFWSDLKTTSIQMSIFLVFALALLLRLNRITGIFGIVRQIVRT